jgi:hypothetical protein
LLPQSGSQLSVAVVKSTYCQSSMWQRKPRAAFWEHLAWRWPCFPKGRANLWTCSHHKGSNC